MYDLPVQEIMTSNLVTINRNDSVAEVANIFKANNFHHLPIVDDEGSLAGIISLTDLERLKTGATLFRNPKKEEYTRALFETTRACEIMTKDIVLLHPTDTIKKAYEIFKKNQFRALPIVEKGLLIGIVTPLDILDYFFSKTK